MFIFDYRLAITKLDVLDQLAEIKIAVAYKYNGEILDSYPGNVVGDNNFDKFARLFKHNIQIQFKRAWKFLKK